jgi:hypothetical protein
MKHIKILILEQNCKDIKAIQLTFYCNELISQSDLTYPVKLTKEEIKNEIDNSITDFSMTVEWVGGRPNDRK